MNNDRTRPRKVLALDRERRAIKLRIAGKLYWEIADELGVTEGAVSKILKRGLELTRQEIAGEADTLRALESERIERLIQKLWPLTNGTKPNLQAFRSITHLLKRRAALLGLDMPREDTLNIPQLEDVKTVLYAPDNGRLRNKSDDGKDT